MNANIENDEYSFDWKGISYHNSKQKGGINKNNTVKCKLELDLPSPTVTKSTIKKKSL